VSNSNGAPLIVAVDVVPVRAVVNEPYGEVEYATLYDVDPLILINLIETPIIV
jgi:hypothetical protein